MNGYDAILKSEEKAVFDLRSLYSRFGYSQYKMSKFEEYDLYVRNKDFLISDSIITFTDTNGKLLALKPDVTLSIIKNSADGKTERLYYNENVYRVSKGSLSYKEIMQVGLECIGDVDDYCLGEVLVLAAESLKTISAECVLDVSHLGIVSEIIDGMALPADARAEVLRCIGEKNLHEIAKICSECGIDAKQTEKLSSLVKLYGAPQNVLPKLGEIVGEQSDSLKQLTLLCGMLAESGYEDIVRIDFSVMNDVKYYNGIVFKGFINSIPSGILSGGQYDNLMKKMGRKSRAVGFAVYLDMLERLENVSKDTDFDCLLLYNENDDAAAVFAAAHALMKDGKSVSVSKVVPTDKRFSEIYKYSDKGVTPIENA